MLVFDLETNGLLNEVTCIHCLVIHDSETDETHVFNDQGNMEAIVRGIQFLEDAETIVGHNILYYDIPVLEKLYPWFKPKGLVVDTLLLSRLFHTNLLNIDRNSNAAGKPGFKRMPQQLWGRHSLESYGYRLNEFKGEYGKTADWKEWSQEMEDYCVQDVKVTCKLCDHFQTYLIGSP